MARVPVQQQKRAPHHLRSVHYLDNPALGSFCPSPLPRPPQNQYLFNSLINDEQVALQTCAAYRWLLLELLCLFEACPLMINPRGQCAMFAQHKLLFCCRQGGFSCARWFLRNPPKPSVINSHPVNNVAVIRNQGSIYILSMWVYQCGWRTLSYGRESVSGLNFVLYIRYWCKFEMWGKNPTKVWDILYEVTCSRGELSIVILGMFWWRPYIWLSDCEVWGVSQWKRSKF